MKNIFFRNLLALFVFVSPFYSNACHLVSITETNSIDNGDGTYTYTFNVCAGIEDSYGFFLTFTGANIISYPASVTGPTSGNTINASVPPVSGSGDIEYGDWDSNAGLLYSGIGNDCVSMTFTFDGSITQADIGGTQAFYAFGPCAGFTTATTCFASSATYSVSITASNSNNQFYSFGFDGGTEVGGVATNGQTDNYLICGCASTFTVLASGGASIPSWTVTQVGVGVVGSGNSEVVNSALTPCVLLPVELVDFNAVKDGSNVLLDWRTITELNNSHFTLERSVDSEGWEQIGSVKGGGTSQEPIDYRFLDVSPYIGVNYYRLKQTDYDGESSYSKTIAIDHSELIVFPNPFTSNPKLGVKAERKQEIEINLSDMTGNTVFKSFVTVDAGEAILDLDFQELEKGIYMLSVRMDDHTSLKKVIKN